MNYKNGLSSYQSRIQSTPDDFQIGESFTVFVSAADNVNIFNWTQQQQ